MDYFMIDSSVVILLLLAILITIQCENHRHLYKIIHLEKAFAIPFSYEWQSFSYPASKVLYPYGPLRLEGVTAKWPLHNDTLLNKELFKVYNDSSVRCPIFNSHQFLSMLRNKIMGVIGDSIAVQMFDGLYNSLSRHAATLYNTTSIVEKHNRNVRAVYYHEYNATIYFCFDSYLKFNKREPCIRVFFKASTDILVFGIGAHFKPKFIDSHRNKTVSYNQSYDLSLRELKTVSALARKYVATQNPNVKVIWRLQPHVGIIDELRYLHNISLKHVDQVRWNNASECAHWVPVYNDIIIKLAKQYGDPVMDWYVLSKQYMHYFFHGMGIPIHVDSMHYRTDGVPRAGALLLQDAVFDLYHEKDV